MPHGQGEFYHPNDPESRPTRYARARFLEQIETHATEVLTDLYGLLPLYADAVPQLSAIGDALLAGMDSVEAIGPDGDPVLEEPEVEPGWVHLVALANEEAPPSLRSLWEDLQPLRSAVREWAEGAHLHEEWLIEAAAETLGSWHTQGPPPVLTWTYPPGAHLLGRTPFHFSHPGWRVRAQSRPEAAEEIRAEFERELRAYLDDAGAVLIPRGWKRSPRKLAEYHFEWLVRYQVQGWSHSRIAASYHAGRRTVGDGLSDAARAVGLTLRPRGRSGRPRKQK